MMTLEKAKADLSEANEALIKATNELKAFSKIGGGLDVAIELDRAKAFVKKAEANLSRALFVLQVIETWAKEDSERV